MRPAAAFCFVALALVAGCGGGDDRPDLAAEAPAAETQTTAAPASPETPAEKPATASPATSAPMATPTRLGSDALRRMASQATVAADALRRWDADVTACVGPEGRKNDPGGACMRATWDQLFDQMYAVQYELLDLLDGMDPGTCHDDLAAALDGVHGFLSGATPLEVVWLDERQRPPVLFDLEAIVDVARPVPARIRAAVATTCTP